MSESADRSTTRRPLRVLHADDDKLTLRAAARVLASNDIYADGALNAPRALQLAELHRYDVALLDWKLSGPLDGLALGRRMRVVSPRTGLIMMTGLNDLGGRLRALDEFADDYLIKPVHPAELITRIRAVARRCAPPDMDEFRLICGPIHVDPVGRKLTLNGTVIQLQPRQLDVLIYLLKHAGSWVNESELLAHVWESHHGSTRSAVVRVQISILRKALGLAGQMIETSSRGEGWRIGANAL